MNRRDQSGCTGCRVLAQRFGQRALLRREAAARRPLHVFEIAERAEIKPARGLVGFPGGAAAQQPAIDQRRLPGVEPVAQRIEVLGEQPFQPRRRQAAQRAIGRQHVVERRADRGVGAAAVFGQMHHRQQRQVRDHGVGDGAGRRRQDFPRGDVDGRGHAEEFPADDEFGRLDVEQLEPDVDAGPGLDQQRMPRRPVEQRRRLRRAAEILQPQRVGAARIGGEPVDVVLVAAAS